jgi:hypothetical protein
LDTFITEEKENSKKLQREANLAQKKEEWQREQQTRERRLKFEQSQVEMELVEMNVSRVCICVCSELI